MKRIFLFGYIFLCTVPFVPANAAKILTDMASVNVTSDTSDTAKKMAMNEARVQVIKQTVTPFIIDTDKFNNLIANSDETSLINLVSSVNIENEKQSATTYSANITMTLDNNAVVTWLRNNYVNNWLGSTDSESKDKKSVVIVLNDGLGNWIELNNLLNNKKIELSVNQISNRQVSASVLSGNISEFASTVQGAGWKYSDNSGIIRIWKQ